MTEKPDISNRLLIGANTFEDANAALALLAHVLRHSNLKLGGVLIEDSTAFDVCRLAHQRVITSRGSLGLVPSPEKLRHLINADARAFQLSLSRIAEQANTSWTFERDIGDLVSKSLKLAAAWDILVVAHRNLHPVVGKVVVLDRAGSAETDMAKFADLLAANLNTERVTLAVKEPVSMPSEGKADKPEVDAINLALARLARMNAQAVLVDLSRGPVCSFKELRRLLDVARCPVFVFGTSSADKFLDKDA